MWSGFQAKKIKIHGEIEHKLSENQARPVHHPDPDQKINFEIFFKKWNPQLCLFTTWKDSLLHQHMSEKRGSSKL